MTLTHNKRALALERDFYSNEHLGYAVYSHLEKVERNQKLKALIRQLAEKEAKHMRGWAQILGQNNVPPEVRWVTRLNIAFYMLVRRLFGLAITAKLLEREEKERMEEYGKAVKGGGLHELSTGHVKAILEDERTNEIRLLEHIAESGGPLDYVRSIIFGLNDGLVEILAVVAGLAAFIQTTELVAVSGFIVGISGTLSMAAGAYLSSKSESVVEESIKAKGVDKGMDPRKEAYYTGIFYFIGALIPVLPFIAGIPGYEGILVAAVLDTVALTIASTIIAVLSDTNIKARVYEMLVISLGTALVTAIIGTIAKLYLGVSI